ncbi:MAG: SMI1/KNR4 family protein [Blastocatellia bacterium]|nr:SMI1/KNR4 family protein [Blastocatellia bacterium]
MVVSDDFWDDSDEFTGPSLSAEIIGTAEASLGYKLPASYIKLLQIRNGGTPNRCCFPTNVPTSWADDHIEICGIRGIGGMWGIDAEELGSKAMIQNWGYPDVGIVIGEMPSAGHDTVMLDYSLSGPQGEPRVIHVETENTAPTVLVLAPDFATFFATFIDGLVSCGQFEIEN